MPDLTGIAGELPHDGRELDDRRGATRADIEDAGAGSDLLHRGEQMRNRVPDKNEVARLLAVSEHVDVEALRSSSGENADHAGIGRGGILPRSVYVEESQAHAGNTMDRPRDRRVKF